MVQKSKKVGFYDQLDALYNLGISENYLDKIFLNKKPDL